MTIETPPLAAPMNHVFVDYENVHQVDLSLIGAKSVSFTLMVGAKQTKLDTDLVERMIEHASSVRLVKLKSSGKPNCSRIMTERPRAIRPTKIAVNPY